MRVTISPRQIIALIMDEPDPLPPSVRMALAVFFMDDDPRLTLEEWIVLEDWFGCVYTDY